MTHDPARYPFEHVLEVAEVASQRDVESVPKLMGWMTDPDAAVRFWAATGCCVRGQSAAPAVGALTNLLKDSSSATRIAAAEGLCRIGQTQQGLDALVTELDAKDADLLRALNALDSLGAMVKPRAAEIQAKMKAANARPDIVKLNGGGGEKYSERAAEDLLEKLRK
jgi:HEAT repeat protein